MDIIMRVSDWWSLLNTMDFSQVQLVNEVYKSMLNELMVEVAQNRNKSSVSVRPRK